MANNAKSANRIQPESLKYVPMRKVARVMALVAGALSSGIVAFSIAEAAWAWAAVFGGGGSCGVLSCLRYDCRSTRSALNQQNAALVIGGVESPHTHLGFKRDTEVVRYRCLHVADNLQDISCGCVAGVHHEAGMLGGNLGIAN